MFRKLFTLAVLVSVVPLAGADSPVPNDNDPSASRLSGLEFRSIGPAFMSGRIADIAIDPDHPATWFVAVGSGGVWKTTNAGTTWAPVFDDQSAYSIGCVTLEPGNADTIWVGTGENVGGRHVGFGDGVYRSRDGGKTWENLGLEDSEHISKILIDPRDPDRVFVAAQGPLWSGGGDRGLFLTTDGGATWKKVLGGGPWTGVTDVAVDPRNPDTMYAATWQRQRSVAALVDGGPESGIHKSTDGGLTWRRLERGLPEEAMGKIGLAVSPRNPDVVYAAIELKRRTGGVWRSDDRGESWEKRSDTVSGATGPHYYQELVADPHRFDRIYLMDVRIKVSDDGGTTFRQLPEKLKHSDNHVLVFLEDDPEFLLAGTDGGLYESRDGAKTWRYIPNLPVTQFYKVALDDREPFYTVYAGSQDNSTQGGPSRTDTDNGIRNADWFVTVFADGHQPAVEPGNPDIVYSQWQQGNLVRTDRTTGEIVYIQPQPEPGDPPERFNWDAPILISPHSPTRLYHASQRVWRSDDRGDSWQAISPDLTRNEDRWHLPLMGRVWSWDSPWDIEAMSKYNTITSLAESPLVEGLLYVGTDDGLIRVSENGGGDWTRIDVSDLPGVPERAYVNDIKADLFDADTAYVALDAHKTGHFQPLLFKSSDRGRTWTSIAGDLPDRHLVWRVVQDHVDRQLMFTGTEFGVFVTLDGGGHWEKLDGGAPTIAFRDLAIQRRENDLVGATFGRGISILDDYSCLREVDDEVLAEPGHLFDVRDAWWYVPRRPLGDKGAASQGADHFIAPNPPFGAVFTYHLAEDLKSLEQTRREAEKKLEEQGKDMPRPPWDELERERREPDPVIVLTVRSENGEVVRRIEGPVTKGFHRVAWDLRYPKTSAVTTVDGGPVDEWEADRNAGWMAPPGRYTVTLSQRAGNVVTKMAEPKDFEVKRLRKGVLDGTSPEEAALFFAEVAALERSVSAAATAIDQAFKRIDLMQAALDQSRVAPSDLDGDLAALRDRLFGIEEKLRGNRSRAGTGEAVVPSILRRLEVVKMGNWFSTYGPTATHRRSFEIAREEFGPVRTDLARLLEVDLPAFERRLNDEGVPWTPGRPLP